MDWITDHILWLLAAGWVLALLLVGRALLDLRRWWQSKPGSSPRASNSATACGSGWVGSRAGTGR